MKRRGQDERELRLLRLELYLRLSASIRGQFSQHFLNLFVMPLLVIAEKGDGCDAVNLTQKRMLENNVAQTLNPVECAKILEATSGAVQVFQPNFLCRCVQRTDCLW